MQTLVPQAPTKPKPVRLHIAVTQADINAGCRSTSSYCPIAYAMVRYFDRPIGHDGIGHLWPAVGLTGMTLPSGEVVHTPREARDFINRFDAGAKVEPFVLELELRVWP